ncbi:methyltransferase [Reyranella sp.]|uniref:methyltransferase n=1 Tax=Reyranella sp. TaxID=1929291 RepID=UPI003BA98599
MVAPAALAPVHAGIEAYYGAKIAFHGATPRGVDWTCAPTQELRFIQLLKVCDFARPFSLNDIGCGYGALIGFILRHHPRADMDYLGVDLSPAMIRRARRRHRAADRRRFVVGCDIPRTADYAVASGIMNVMLDQPRELWEAFAADTLERMRASSRLGFAVNFLAEKPDGSPPGLYRTDPARWTSFCRETLRCDVELVEGYGMREFTILARPA